MALNLRPVAQNNAETCWRTLTRGEFEAILKKHKRWLDKKPGGARADLSRADLGYADLFCANLRYADLTGVNLRYADLTGSNLRYADLTGVNLRYADLTGVNLRYADLTDARGLPSLTERGAMP